MDAKEIAETIIKNNAVYTWSDKTMQLARAYLELKAKNAELRETIHNAKEIYTGMEGFTARTAPEAYLQRMLEQMYNELTGQENK